MQRQFFCSLLALAACSIVNGTLLARGLDIIGDIPIENNNHVKLGYPTSDHDDQVLISKKQYVVSWNISQRIPQWVGWAVNKRYLGSVGRTGTFYTDSALKTYLEDWNYSAVSPKEYDRICLDRGHQVASADRTSTVLDNKSTFMMSNVAPQTAFLNRKYWVSLERFLRRLVLEQNMEVFIYSGGNGKNLGYVGENSDILLKERNFKVALIKPAGNSPSSFEKGRILTVDFPNTTSKGTNPITDFDQACYDSEHTMRLDETNRSTMWRKYRTKLANVEKSSDLDFSFLAYFPEISETELDLLVLDQSKAGIQYFSPYHILNSLSLSKE